MNKKLTVVLGQLNLIVGDLAGNLAKHIKAAIHARDVLKADMIVFPELSMTGYPPEDLLNRLYFVKAAEDAVDELKQQVAGIYMLVGHPTATSEGLYNSCSLLYNHNLVIRHDKQALPNYGVFDEKRYFISGTHPSIVTIGEYNIAIMLCEDLWHDDPIKQYLNQNIHLVVVPNASPFETDKEDRRKQLLLKRTQEINAPIVYVNCVGGQDEVIFDGSSLVAASNGEIFQHAAFGEEHLLAVDFNLQESQLEPEKGVWQELTLNEKIYTSLVLGVRDYFTKNNFQGALIGVSGGIDSALTLAIAVDALGHENVRGVIMPSRYTADISMIDAKLICENFKVQADIVSIEPAYQTFIDLLKPVFKDAKADVTEENIQARCRAIILMGISNKSHYIVLNTSNRSEMAVGYSTLYGDMVGGYAVLKDVPKMLVYELSALRNKKEVLIPQRIIDRAPSAELADNQKDEDSLPPYPILDEILFLYLNKNLSAKEIIAKGFEASTVERIIKLIYRNEYKRRQAPIGTRISHAAFSRDRRYPITSGFKENS